MRQLADQRRVITFDRDGFARTVMPGLPDEDVWWNNISYDRAAGHGSHLMVMAPGPRCKPHRRNGPEEFLVVQGDPEARDGHLYRAGDFVSLSAGPAHFPVSHSGCKLAATHRGPLDDLSLEEMEAPQ